MRLAADRDLTLFTATKSQLQMLACSIAFALAPSWVSAHEISPGQLLTTRVRYLMGTLCEVSVAASKDSAAQISLAFEEIARVERLLSTWQDDTPLSRLNAAPPGSSTLVDAELFGILERATRWASRTGSAFNPLVGELIDLWKTRGEGALPDPARLARATSDASITTVTFDPAGLTITRHSSAQFEEGAFGKGYAIDRALAALEAAGARRATINFGGQIGQAEEPDFAVVVTDPEKRDHPAVTVATSQRSISTSSGSEKSFEIGGRRLSHILDPRDGKALPPRGSVTVFASSGFDADVLSTALFVMGPHEGLSWANEHGIDALFIVPDQRGGKHKVIPSASLAGRAGAISTLDPHFILKVAH